MVFLGELLVSALLVIGGLFGLIGAIGLVKLPDPMSRVHSPTKSATLGVGCVLLGSLAWFTFFGVQIGWHEPLITIFLFLTAPLSGLVVSKLHMHKLWREKDLPAPHGNSVWPTYGKPERHSLIDEPSE